MGFVSFMRLDMKKFSTQTTGWELQEMNSTKPRVGRDYTQWIYYNCDLPNQLIDV